MDREQAVQDLELISRVLDGTRRRVDPQMFHAIVWGTIVLVWYPLMSWFERSGDRRAELVVSIAAIAGGSVLSAFLGWRSGRRPRLPAANAHLARRVGALTAIFIATGILLSMAVPSLVQGGERFIPHVWGLLYALMLMTLGVVYSGECFFCGLPSLIGTIVALRFPSEAGFILGPAMGLGCIVAGVIAERRVARLRLESVAGGDEPSLGAGVRAD